MKLDHVVVFQPADGRPWQTWTAPMTKAEAINWWWAITRQLNKNPSPGNLRILPLSPTAL